MFNRSTTPQKDMKQNTAGRARNAGDAETAGKVLFAKNKQERREDQMDSLKRELLIRKQSLEKAIEKAVDVISAAPDGSLQIDSSKKFARYFLIPTNSSKRVYISDKESEFATRLANKEYAEKLLERAKSELNEIERYLARLDRKSADQIYSQLKPARRQLVTPIMLDGKTSRERWCSQSYEKSSNHPEHLRFQTRRGELVRSKSEAFIANIYFEYGIPYRYECALVLRENVILHPDFTILDTLHRRIVYHEHLGCLDKPDYIEEQMWKFREYRKNGIYIGKNLIITGETEGYPFNPEQFRSSVREIFLV